MSGAGFQNDLVYAKNADFSGSAVPSETNGLYGNNKFWIGNNTNTIDVLTLTQGSGISFTKTISAFTISASSTVPTSFPTDSGTATPLLNQLNLLGSGSLTTSGSGNTVTHTLTGLTNHSVLVGAGTSTIT